MQQPYLEVTFRNGKPLAAYYYLTRRPDQRAHHTRSMEAGLVVDFDENGAAIGIEITAPTALTIEAFNRVLEQLGQQPVIQAALAPLRAA